MNILKDYSFAGVVGLVAAIAVTIWLDQPDTTANTMVFAVTFLIVTGLAQALWKLMGGGKKNGGDDGS